MPASLLLTAQAQTPQHSVSSETHIYLSVAVILSVPTPTSWRLLLKYIVSLVQSSWFPLYPEKCPSRYKSNVLFFLWPFLVSEAKIVPSSLCPYSVYCSWPGFNLFSSHHLVLNLQCPPEFLSSHLSTKSWSQELTCNSQSETLCWINRRTRRHTKLAMHQIPNRTYLLWFKKHISF